MIFKNNQCKNARTPTWAVRNEITRETKVLSSVNLIEEIKFFIRWQNDQNMLQNFKVFINSVWFTPVLKVINLTCSSLKRSWRHSRTIPVLYDPCNWVNAKVASSYARFGKRQLLSRNVRVMKKGKENRWVFFFVKSYVGYLLEARRVILKGDNLINHW